MIKSEQDILDAIGDGSIERLLKPLNSEEIDALVEKAKTDPGAPFESEAIARIAATKEADIATFIRIRERLKVEKIKVSLLDELIDKQLGRDDIATDEDKGLQGHAITFPKIEPWPEPVDGAALFDDVVAQIERYVMLAHESAVAIAFWIMHAYCFNLFRVSPRLVITSPEKRCGKTTLVGVIQALVPRPLVAASITAAAMFRTIEKFRPTLLIDEADTFLPQSDELRGIIDAGHNRDGQVIRLVGDNHEPRGFAVFCPTVLAAIGEVPSTIEDRAIPIPMRRRKNDEPIERFEDNQIRHLDELKRRIVRWVADHETMLAKADPQMPNALHDRERDNWRGLLAIADLAGGDWTLRVRMVAQALSAQGSDQDEQSRRVMLLADIRRVFDDRRKSGCSDADRISSSDLANALGAFVDRPWATWAKGKQIAASTVARLLKSFSIFPNTIKLSNGKQPNGYKHSQFEDAFARYLPAPDSSDQSSPPSPISANSDISARSNTSPQTRAGEHSNLPHPVEKYGLGEHGEPPENDLVSILSEWGRFGYNPAGRRDTAPHRRAATQEATTTGGVISEEADRSGHRWKRTSGGG